MCLEAQDSNPQQDEGGDLQCVCRKRQSGQTTFVQHPNWHDAPARVDLLCVDDIFRQPEALMSKTGHRQRTPLGSQRFIHRAAIVGTQLSYHPWRAARFQHR